MYLDKNCPDCIYCCDDDCTCIGITGPTGATGMPGATGPAGMRGERGATGPQGERGIAGPQGPQGIEGPRGPQGLAGAEGPQGEIGNTGPIGPMGPTGAKGERGIAGPQGPQGIEGPRGAQGLMGPEGPQGEPGATGPEGLQGIPGPQGERGPTGATGPQGEQGVTGASGGIAAQSFAAASAVGGAYTNAMQLRLTPYITDTNQDIVFTSDTTLDVTEGYYYVSYEVSGMINPAGYIIVTPVFNNQPQNLHSSYDNAATADANVQVNRSFILYAPASTRLYLQFNTNSVRISDAECHVVIVKLIR